MKSKILIAEPEEMFAVAAAYALENAGYEVAIARDSRQVLDKARLMQPDLCILSAELPSLSKKHLCCDLFHEEALGPNASLFMLGSDGREEFCAAMLDCGADDYLAKPFGMHEFMARIRVLLRRSHQPIQNPDRKELRVGQFVLNAVERTLCIGDPLQVRELKVTHTETQLLQLLMENAGQLVTYNTIVERVGSNPNRSTSALRQLIVTLRRKIGDTSTTPRHIISLHGQGLRFEP